MLGPLWWRSVLEGVQEGWDHGVARGGGFSGGGGRLASSRGGGDSVDGRAGVGVAAFNLISVPCWEARSRG